ncbi:MAG: hypothetical protein JNL01_00915 [Bdellovibrionales bacterium]|nr:hypothetical protein [Bdellovibrionales bacterium]
MEPIFRFFKSQAWVICGIWILQSCAPIAGRPTATVGLKTRTVKDLVLEKGQPQEKEENALDRGLQVYRYSGEENYQVDPATQVVQARFRNPVGSEEKVQYWLHEFQNCKTRREETRSKDLHQTSVEVQLTCAERGTSVLFEAGNGYVKRVIEHGQE